MLSIYNWQLTIWPACPPRSQATTTTTTASSFMVVREVETVELQLLCQGRTRQLAAPH